MSKPVFRVYPDELDLASIVERLGAIIGYYRQGQSTHERTKEVWGALKTLLRISEKRWSEWTPLLVERYTPERMSSGDTEYFKQLFKALLSKFASEVKGYTPAMKLHLAKILRSALDSASANPYPQLCFFVSEFHPDRLCDKRFVKKCSEVLGLECR